MTTHENLDANNFDPEDSYEDCLRKMNQLYKDNVPKEIIHSTSTNNRYKARKGWFAGLTFALDYGINAGKIIDPEIIGAIKDFEDYIMSPPFSDPNYLTRPDDIARGKQIIEKVLASIKP